MSVEYLAYVRCKCTRVTFFEKSIFWLNSFFKYAFGSNEWNKSFVLSPTPFKLLYYKKFDIIFVIAVIGYIFSLITGCKHHIDIKVLQMIFMDKPVIINQSGSILELSKICVKINKTQRECMIVNV